MVSILTKIIELVGGRWIQNLDRVRAKKDAIGQEFNKIYLDGKGHGFSEPPRDDDHFRKVILDIEKYDMALSNKLAKCRSSWELGAISIKNPNTRVTFGDFDYHEQDFQGLGRETEKLANEVYKEIKERWVI